MTQEQKDLLESMIDGSTLAEVLESLAEICYEKAEHIRVNWQDRETARPWDKMGKKIDTLSSNSEV